MSTSNRAKVNNELLVWGRQMSGMPRHIAAKKIGVSDERLKSWEDAQDSPTVNQLRNLAKTYKQSFAAFYLKKAPSIPELPLKDYRRLPGAIRHEISHEIIMDIRNNMDRRQITLELLHLNQEEPKEINFNGNITESVVNLANRIRENLNLSIQEQFKFREPRKGFNSWRKALENFGVLVFQSASIDIDDMRGYSVYKKQLPFIVVNRKDTESSRIFTLIHELVHLYLRSSGLCDLESRTDIPPEEQYLEQYCNSVAANVLVPAEHFLNHTIITDNHTNDWSELEISRLARDYCVSREMIARRLTEVGIADVGFYKVMREKYLDEYKKSKSKKRSGFVSPSVDVISKGGNVFSGIIIRSLKSHKINSSQASELLGIKLKHIKKISSSLGY